MTNKIIELAEKIVIDYANLSGRETYNLAEFRERVIKHLKENRAFLCEKIEQLEVDRDYGEQISKSEVLKIIKYN